MQPAVPEPGAYLMLGSDDPRPEAAHLDDRTAVLGYQHRVTGHVVADSAGRRRVHP